MSQLTDKEVFEILSQVLQKVVKINEYFSPDLKENIQVEYGRDNYKYIRADIKWSHPSHQYPPPAAKLEPCRYCKSPVKHYGNTVDHPVVDNCILSGKCFKYELWPKIPATIKDSLLVQKESRKSYDPEKYCFDENCKYWNDKFELNCSYSSDNSKCVKDDTPSLESLGLDPVEVWENAPGWSIEIILQKWENGKIVPYFTGKDQTKSLRDPITLPPGVDWKKCIWKRPEEKTVPDDGGNGWVPCPECEDDKEEQNEND